jgi:hypothetical protein
MCTAGVCHQVCEEPPTIQLNFEHQATDQAAGLDGFYATSKANRCVVCGNDTHYLRCVCVGGGGGGGHGGGGEPGAWWLQLWRDEARGGKCLR